MKTRLICQTLFVSFIVFSICRTAAEATNSATKAEENIPAVPKEEQTAPVREDKVAAQSGDAEGHGGEHEWGSLLRNMSKPEETFKLPWQDKMDFNSIEVKSGSRRGSDQFFWGMFAAGNARFGPFIGSEYSLTSSGAHDSVMSIGIGFSWGRAR